MWGDIGVGWGGSSDANTMLLAHFDGADASTTFIDSSLYNRTLTAQGNAQIDTGQSVFGGSSLQVDGSGDYVTWASDSLLDFPSGNFTFEGRLRANGSPGDHWGIGGQLNSGFSVGGYGMEIDESGSGKKLRILANYTDGSNQNVYGTTTIASATWYHFAYVRNGTDFRLYVNGTSENSFTSAKTLRAGTNGSVLGRLYTDSNNFYFNGWLEEVRISNIARWTANFTPPAGPY